MTDPLAIPPLPAGVPILNGGYVPHSWTALEPGGVCKRCGADYPTRESCR